MKHWIWLGLAVRLFAQSEPEFRVAEIDGQLLRYTAHQGRAIVHGDILIGTVEEVEAAARGEEKSLKRIRSANVARATLWTNNTIPYVIDADIPNPQRLLDGIAHWNTRTPLRVVRRTTEANYVRFVRVTGDFACRSALGMRGGEQTLDVTDVCTAGNTIHEIGHAFGLLHEQERFDRDQYVTVIYPNLDKRFMYAFDQDAGSRPSGYYDYDSIMHYGPSGFTRTGSDSLATIPLGIPIGQRTALSAADIDEISRLYGIRPTTTTITTIPAGGPVVVDGQSFTTPRAFNWTPGSRHTIATVERAGTDPQNAFVRWTDGGALEHEVQASVDRTVIAAVFQVRHRVATSVASGQGQVSLRMRSADGSYPDQESVLIEATPAAGSSFYRWTGSTNFSANGYGVSAPRVTLDVALANDAYGANFTTSPVTTITSEPPGRTVTVDGTAYLTPISFLFASGTSHTMSVVTTQAAGNNTVRYRFSAWSDAQTAATRTFTANAANTTIVARFTTQYLLTYSVSGTGTLSATPSSTDGFYDAGTPVTLSATQPIRYWVGDTFGGGQSKIVVMDEQKLAVAVFNTPLTVRPLSAASYQGQTAFGLTGTVVAPYEIVTLFGSNLGPPNLTLGQVENGRLTTRLEGTRVLFDGVPSPLIYVSANQTSAIVPGSVLNNPVPTVFVERNGTIVSSLGLTSGVPAKPALFTADSSGSGPVAALNQDGTVNGPRNPAEAGSVVVFYGTGAGLMDRTIADGLIMDTNLARPQGVVSVKFGKLAGEVFYGGTAPFLVNGVLQINVRIPADTLPGLVPVQFSIGQWTSPIGTTIYVR